MFSPSIMLRSKTAKGHNMELNLKRKSNATIINPFKKLGAHDDDDDSDEEQSNPFKFPMLGKQDSDVYTEHNHIFFKTDVTEESIDKLSQEIDKLTHKLTNIKRTKNTYGTFTPKPIMLHITTRGGDLLAGLYAFDKIRDSKIPIHTIIEGRVASAGSLMSMAGIRRYITPNSHILIHQLRTGMFGTYEELKDETQNCNNLMNKIINLYFENCNTKMNKTKIRDILKHDIYWDAKIAMTHGVVDEIWKGGDFL